MIKRKGVFIGAFVPADMKRRLQTIARGQHWPLTKLLVIILSYALKHMEEILKEETKKK